MLFVNGKQVSPVLPIIGKKVSGRNVALCQKIECGIVPKVEQKHIQNMLWPMVFRGLRKVTVFCCNTPLNTTYFSLIGCITANSNSKREDLREF